MLYTLLLFINLFQTSQESPKTFELINTESGLSNNIVYDIYQDKEGFMWMATDNGLNRYDGYSFKKFYHDPMNSTSLSSNIIRRILEDKKGNLWIGTKNGIDFYDREREKFIRYNIESDSNISIDTQQGELDKNGKIWFNNVGVFGYFDLKTKDFKILDPSFHSNSMTIEKDSIIWVNSTWGQLGSVNVDSLKFRKRADKKEFKKQIHYGRYSNSMWLPESFSNDIFETAFKIIPKLPGGVEPFKLKEIDKHTLLIGSDKGLYEYNYLANVLKEISLTNSLSTLTRQIRSIYKDVNGGIWIGTLGGVFHYDNYKNNFDHFDLNRKEVDVVMGLEAGVNGIYANTLGEGIYYKSNNSKTFEKLNKGTVFSDQELFIWGIEEVPENEYEIWLSTNTGLIRYDPQKNRKKKIDLPVVNEDVELSFNIHNTNENHVWVASMRTIHKIDKKSGKRIVSYPISSRKSLSIIQKIVEFENRLILATESHGLFMLDKNTGMTSFIKLKENSKKEASVFKTSIWDLHVFQNVLWIGTSRGLFKLQKGEKIATPVFVDNQIVFSILHDKKGSLWFGTERGLVNYEIETGMIRRYGKIDGLKNIEFNRRSATTTNDGKLWFGGVHGITVFDPLKIKTNSIVPPVHITNLKVITSDSTFVMSRDNRKIVLPYNQNTIELDYIGLNYTNSSQNMYKYQMIGLDPDWVTDQSRKVRYSQLPTGNYTFHVIASNNDGLWNEVGDQIQIQILPPYWEAWWFRSMIILLIGGIIYTLYKYRVKRLLAVERMKLRIASDLHDEVGSGLSGIALTSDILEQQVHEGNIKPHLVSRITKNARNLASTLDDIVWLINPEKESLEDLIIKSKTIAQELLPEANLSFKEEVLETIKNKVLASELKRNLLLFIKEVINNVAKHAEANTINITFEMQEQMFTMCIVDNGKGFDVNKKTSGNGIASIRNRAKQMNGVLEMRSEIDKGTTISLIVKIP